MGRQSVRHGPGPQKSTFYPCAGWRWSCRAVNWRKHHFSQRHGCFFGWDKKDPQTIEGKAKNCARQSLLSWLEEVILREEKRIRSCFWSWEQRMSTDVNKRFTEIILVSKNRAINTKNKPDRQTVVNRLDLTVTLGQHWGVENGQHVDIFGQHILDVIDSEDKFIQHARLGWVGEYSKIRKARKHYLDGVRWEGKRR